MNYDVPSAMRRSLSLSRAYTGFFLFLLIIILSPEEMMVALFKGDNDVESVKSGCEKRNGGFQPPAPMLKGKERLRNGRLR